MKKILLLLIISLVTLVLKAQNPIDTTNKEAFYTPTFDELNGMERVDKSEASVSVAGFTTTTLRESPGIVTLITSEDIQRMGARDLVDVLRFVPGFDIAIDVLPVFTIRGNGVNEGKMLVLIDGHPINNIGSGYSFIYQRFSLTNIDRIEIIRGAGSAIYGGLAGLAVINIQTKKATTHKQETSVTGFTTFTKNGSFQTRGEAYSLHKLKGDIDLNIAASYNQGQVTDNDFQSPVYFTLVEARKYSLIESSNMNIGLRYKHLDIRYLQNNMLSVHPEFDNTKLHTNYTALALRYFFNINEKITVHTKLTWNGQSSFFTDIPRIPPLLGISGKLESLEKLNLVDKRYLANVYAVYQPTQNITITAGAETHRDRSKYFNQNLFSNGKKFLAYSNIGTFVEANIKSKFVNITAGIRRDRYANIKPIAVPRIALTRAFKHVHFKALYTLAFKTPTIGNIESSQSTGIEAEKFRLIEFEAGAKINKNLQFNVNVFNILITNFILRTELNTSDFFFANSGDNGTQGIEGEARYRNHKLALNIGYSFYQLSSRATSVLARYPTVNPGTPAQKATLTAYYDITPRLQMNLTFIHLTNKFQSSNFAPTKTREFSNEQHINLYGQYKDFLLKNLTVSLGVYNLLNQEQYLLSWKKDLLSAVFLSTQGREVALRLTYQIKN
jgi:outer membrane receptor for ferrienterochelin and colicin